MTSAARRAFDNFDLMIQISFFLVSNNYYNNPAVSLSPLLPLFYVFRSLLPLVLENERYRLISYKHHFVCSQSMIDWVRSIGCELSNHEILFYVAKNNETSMIQLLLSQNPENLKNPFLFNGAASGGNIYLLRHLNTLLNTIDDKELQSYPYKLSKFTFSINLKAIQHGHIQILEWIKYNHQNELQLAMNSSLNQISSSRRLQVEEWFNQYPLWDEKSCATAIKYGQLIALHWLREQDPPCSWDQDCCIEAATKGDLFILSWLRAQDPPCPWDTRCCQGAAEFGHFEVLKWLKSQNPPCPWDKFTCAYAAEGGHLEILKWLRTRNPPCPWGSYTCAHAAKGGHIEVLSWIRSQDPPCPWSGHTSAYAARNGKLEVLKWLRSQDPPCPWDERTIAAAAENGHIDILIWLRDQEPPCPWDSDCSAYAAEKGQFEVLKWLRAQNPSCPWDEWTCTKAAGEGYLQILQWLRAQEPPCPWEKQNCLTIAIMCNHFDIADWISIQDE